jgi:molybdopterin/thiamine biosynthesis adenylyltransferase
VHLKPYTYSFLPHSSFFLTENDLGMPRAQKACEHLRELNPDVNGHFIVERNLAQRLQSSPGFLDDFSVVVACNLASSLLLPLADVLWQKKVGSQMKLAGQSQPWRGGWLH